MKKNFKILSVVGLAAVVLGAAGALTACQGGNPTSTTSAGGNTTTTTTTSTPTPTGLSLTVSGPATQQSWLEQRLAVFNEERAAAGLETVTFEFVAHGEDKVDTEVTDWTSGPDVYAYASDKIMPLYQAGALAEVPAENQEFIVETMTEASLDAVTFAGKVVSYPYAGDNGYFLYYNKSYLDLEDCATIEGLLDKAAELGYGVAYPLGTAFYSAGALFTFGARYTLTTDENGTVTSVEADFDSEKGILAGKAIYQIMKHEAFVDQADAAPIVANNLIACVDGSWNASKYQGDMGEDYAATKLPTVTVDGQTANLSSYLGYKQYGVNPQRSSGDATRLALAHEVAKFLCSEESQESRFDTFQTAPTNVAVAELDKVKNNIAVKAINEQSEFAVPQTAVPAAIWTAPTTFTQGIKDGSVTLENIANQMTVLNDAVEASR